MSHSSVNINICEERGLHSGQTGTGIIWRTTSLCQGTCSMSHIVASRSIAAVHTSQIRRLIGPSLKLITHTDADLAIGVYLL